MFLKGQTRKISLCHSLVCQARQAIHSLPRHLNAMTFFTRKTFCIVTGGSGGLGREIALQFARRWCEPGATADIVLLSRDKEAMLESKKMIEEVASGTTVHVVQVDLGDIQNLEGVCARIWALYDSSLHEQAVLVLNAGSLGKVSQTVAQQTNPGPIHDYMAVNFTSTWVLSASFLSHFTSGPRLILNITSLLSRVPMGGCAAYGCGKAARSLLMGVIAAENPDVRVLNYSPGPLDTKMFHTLKNEVQSEAGRKIFQDTVDQGKLLTCETSVNKLIGLLEEDKFENGATADYYDE